MGLAKSAIICSLSPLCAWVMAVTNVPAAMAGASAVFAAVFDSVTTNLFGSYDNEYDGRSAVSITRRVLFPG